VLREITHRRHLDEANTLRISHVNALDAASAAYTTIEGDIQTKSAEERKLNRIRRVCRHVRTREELTGEIEALGAIATLPENASQVLETALNDENQAGARLATVDDRRWPK
jgi:hypothetical protein